VEQNIPLGYMWATIAAEDGDHKAKNLRDYLAAELKPGDIADAKKKAALCRASKFRDCD